MREGIHGWKAACGFATILIALLAAVSADASTMRDPRIERIGVEDGLPDGTVYSVAIDSEGFLWFGTANGLARYDGYGFTVYTHDPASPTSISTNLASHAFADRQGRLWVGTWGGGLERYEPSIDGFAHFPHRSEGLADSRIQTLFEDHDGAIWLGTFGEGLQRLDPETSTFDSYVHDPNDPETLSDPRVWAIEQSPDGMLWIATSAGLDRLDPTTGKVRRNALCGGTDSQCLPDPEVRAVLSSDSGELWVGTRDGLVVLAADGSRRTYRQGEKGLLSSIINTIYEDRQGRIWIGTTYGGLNLWDDMGDSFRVFRYEGDNPNSLSNDDVRCIIDDRAGLLWIGTRGEGVNKLDPATPFTRYRYNPDDPEGGLAHPRVWSVATDADGTIWAGTSTSLDRIDRSGKKITHIRHEASRPDGLAPGEVRVLHVDSAGTLWVATQERGLQRVVKSSARSDVVRFESIPPREFGDSRVSTMADGGDGTVYFGTHHGVFSLVGGSVRPILVSGEHGEFQLQEDGVTALAYDPGGALWIGTQGTGIYRYDLDRDAVTHYENNPVDVTTLSRNDILSLAVGDRETLWVGTRGGGLNRLDALTGRFARLTTSDGLPNNVIHSLVRDEGGFIWIGTNLGLSRFDPGTGSFRNFDVSDGIQGTSFLAGSVHRSQWNEIFFGGVNGLTAFFPSEVRNVDRSFVPPVRITAVRLFGDEIDTKGPVWATSSIVLGPSDDYLSIEFAVLDFTNPQRNRYSYKLEGFDRDWVDAGSKREASYTNLDGGDYVFKVRGANHLGAWNEEGATMNIRVVPPFFERRWFQFGVLALVAAIVWLTFRLRLRGIRRSRERLGDLVQARTAELEAKTVELEHAYRAAEEVSYTDALTGLRNRHFLRDTIDHDVARVVREYETRLRRGDRTPPERTDLLFVLADLDRFKLVNDTSGHRAGDRVLAQMGALFQQRSRESDLVIRWGGEEFLILYRSVDREQAPVLVEQLRTAVEQRLFELGDGTLQKMTCSFGFAAFPFDRDHPKGLDWERVLELADQALYESKRSGRNTWTGVEAGPNRTRTEIAYEVRGRIGELIERRELAWIRRSR